MEISFEKVSWKSARRREVGKEKVKTIAVLRRSSEEIGKVDADESEHLRRLRSQGCGKEEHRRRIAYRGRRIALQACGRKEARLQARTTRLRKRRTSPKGCVSRPKDCVPSLRTKGTSIVSSDYKAAEMKNTAEGLRIEAEGLRSKPVDERKLDCKLGVQGCGDEEHDRRVAFQACGRKEPRL